MKVLITGACGHIGSYLLENIYKIKKVKKTILVDNLESNRFNSLFNNLKKLRANLSSLNISPDQLVISSDSALSLFGLKNSKTLYVSTNNKILLKEIKS